MRPIVKFTCSIVNDEDFFYSDESETTIPKLEAPLPRFRAGGAGSKSGGTLSEGWHQSKPAWRVGTAELGLAATSSTRTNRYWSRLRPPSGSICTTQPLDHGDAVAEPGAVTWAGKWRRHWSGSSSTSLIAPVGVWCFSGPCPART